MKELRIASIGVGNRGRLIYKAHDPENGVHVVATADPDLIEQEKFRKEINGDVSTYSDYRDILARDDIDAVFITSPDYFHEEHAVAALESGKAIFLEKPMAITIEGCDKILEAAMRTGSKLYIGHNMRHFPVITKMKEIIDSGAIGEVKAAWCRHFINYGGEAYFKDWHSERRYSNGLLLQKGAHDIDLIHWLSGGITQSVVGMGMLSVYDQCEKRTPECPKKVPGDKLVWPPSALKRVSEIVNVEDHNMIMMQLDNGVQASYTQCHYTPDTERNYTFIGTEGRIENIGDMGDAEIHVWNQIGSRQEPDIIYKIKAEEGGHGGADPKILKAFLDYVRYDIPINISPVEARNSVAVGVQAHKSMRNGCNRYDIPVLSKEIIDYFSKKY